VPTSQYAKMKLKIRDEDPSGATQSGRKYLSAIGEPTTISRCLFLPRDPPTDLGRTVVSVNAQSNLHIRAHASEPQHSKEVPLAL